MGRRRRASLWAGTGIRYQNGQRCHGYYARYSDYDQAGRRICRSQHFLQLRDAKTWVRDYNAKADLKKLGSIVPLPLREATAEFLAGCSTLKPDTITHYSSAVGALSGLVGDLNVCEITGQIIDSFISNRLARSNSEATVLKHLASLRRFFNWAVKRSYLESNPIEDATTIPRGRPTRKRPQLTTDDLARLVQQLDTDDRRLAVWIAATAGLDRNVIANLSAVDVDLEGLCIRIRRPKTNKVVTVPIHCQLAPLLSERIRRTPSGPLLRGLARQNRDRDWWHQAAEKAGLTDLWFRDLRAFASARVQREGGLSLADARDLLGHSSVETTASHYQLPGPGLRQAIDALPLPGFRKRRGRTKG